MERDDGLNRRKRDEERRDAPRMQVRSHRFHTPNLPKTEGVLLPKTEGLQLLKSEGPRSQRLLRPERGYKASAGTGRCRIMALSRAFVLTGAGRCRLVSDRLMSF
ncbi:hypothetical protein GCM10009547_00750 [Sporichthya brevicatena]|uniref:Uncharacterized protein n=1 Tax=Sporichthya brevicatena TaxID=171442 RepID=A0ABP3R5L3_9ACTN